MARSNPDQISPTAHYTGYVWFANGLSHEAFATPQGKLMYLSLRLPNALAERTGRPSLDGMLLARHRLIDLRLTEAIEDGEVSQIVEVACGLSPRGWRFHQRYGERITYIEADLPGMIKNKQRVLASLGGESSTHRTAELDALDDNAFATLGLDPDRGTAILTEGLINYFDRATVLAMWQRFARVLAPFPRGVYFSDVIVEEANRGWVVAGFSRLLSAFVRGRVHVHFADAIEVETELEHCGFAAIALDPRDFINELPGLEGAGAGRVKVIEALAGHA
ncbi:class I SAM-dependent methyltransferase [soil metagenome]